MMNNGNKIEKVSLQTRLDSIKATQPQDNPLDVFEMNVDEFFLRLEEMTDDLYYSELYFQQIERYNWQDDRNYTMAEMVNMAKDLPAEESLELLYLLLIEPFVMLAKANIYGKEIKQ